MTDPYRYSDPLNGKILGQDIRIRDIFDMFEEVEVVRVFPRQQALEWSAIADTERQSAEGAQSPYTIARYFVGGPAYKPESKYLKTLHLSLTTENVITFRTFDRWEPGWCVPNYAICRDGSEVTEEDANQRDEAVPPSWWYELNPNHPRVEPPIKTFDPSHVEPVHPTCPIYSKVTKLDAEIMKSLLTVIWKEDENE